MAFLELTNVGKGYSGKSGHVDVLRNVNLEVEEGEFVAIVGYSGAGKSTLISLIAGLIQPDQGTVKLKGLPVTDPGPDRGVVFQNYSLLPWLTVYENVFLSVDQVFPNWPARRKREHTEKYIGMVSLTAAQDKRPRELSGGMRQRVSVARTLAMEPQILLLDEPLSALDALTRGTLQDEIVRIWEQERRTVILITNDVDEGILMADRIIPLSAGPAATLGPQVDVTIPRPRDRKAINHDDRYKAIRKQVISYLLGEGAKPRASISVKLTLPDLIPEDLERRGAAFGRRKPRRRNETKREEVEVQG